MKTSISPRPLSSGPRLLPSAPFAAAPSRSNKMVDAGRGAMASGLTSLRRAGLRLQVGALVDPRDAGEQIVHLGLCSCRNARTRLALRAGGDHATLLQHIFAHRQARTGLLLVADQWQMGVEQIVRGVALAGFREFYNVDQQFREGVT